MNKIQHIKTLMASCLLGVLMLSVIFALWAYKDIPAEVLEKKYLSKSSRFMNISGVRVHYRDEGPKEAPAILLLHANFASLLGWEPWVKALEDKYRVIRFDFTSHGLTGPDPSGDYTMERTLNITKRFIDATLPEQFSIAGTSMGGTVALLYASQNPERINNLILLSPGALAGQEQKNRGDVPDEAYILKYIMPRALPEFMLRGGVGDPDNLDQALVDRWYDMWRREGQREAQLDRLKQYKVENLEAIIQAIKTKVLLMWGEENRTANFEQSREFLRLLKNANSVDFISYPGVGHMAVQEAGDRIALDVRAFMDNKLDSKYRFEN
ncbi:MAG: alpha/beta hydrolase [Pseudomonadota bacterium]|nr:alpha/beta hydrolase [Pseudomonadota bacterium]